jgi:hypothetical protein
MTPNPRLMAKVVAATILDDSFTKNIGFPINGYDYRLDISMIEKAIHIPEDIKEWVIDNKREFEDMVNSSISNHLKYIELEGFGFQKNGIVKLYTDKQLTNHLEKILK